MGGTRCSLLARGTDGVQHALKRTGKQAGRQAGSHLALCVIAAHTCAQEVCGNEGGQAASEVHHARASKVDGSGAKQGVGAAGAR